MTQEHRRAKAAFTGAMSRLRDLPGLQHGRLQPLTSAQCKELSELAQAAVVEAMLWARAFDDAARGSDGLAALVGYPPEPPEVMKAARYVANKGIHVLIELTDVTQEPVIGAYAQTPWSGSLQMAALRWVTPDRLPPDRVNNQGDVRRNDAATRTSFVTHWAASPYQLLSARWRPGSTAGNPMRRSPETRRPAWG